MSDNSSPAYKKILIGLLGGIVLLIGIIAIPYPGPGWLIVFAGLGILSTEFAWAQSALDSIKKRYEVWQEWLNAQPFFIKASVWTATCIIVIMTIWLLNGYWLLGELLNIKWDWLQSPILG